MHINKHERDHAPLRYAVRQGFTQRVIVRGAWRPCFALYFETDQSELLLGRLDTSAHAQLSWISTTSRSLFLQVLFSVPRSGPPFLKDGCRTEGLTILRTAANMYLEAEVVAARQARDPGFDSRWWSMYICVHCSPLLILVETPPYIGVGLNLFLLWRLVMTGFIINK